MNDNEPTPVKARPLLRNVGTVGAGVAVVLALAGAAFLLWPGAFTVESCSGIGGTDCREVDTWASDGIGRISLFWSAVVVALAIVPLFRRTYRARLVVGLSLLVFVVAGSASIGLVFAPATLVMLASAALPPYRATEERW